ncbi:MAG: DUF349 domain-containing protein [Propionibacteriales bacterium]|nr:DUF349 domain-containing protein [Propionibacteriales bacterium]
MTEQPAPSESATLSPFGRVDADGTVYVTTRSGERVVGQWPDGDPQAALAFYQTRYDGLAVEIDLLEQRIKAGALSAEDASRAAAKVIASIGSAQAVGDLDTLTDRVEALAPLIEERRQQRKAERAAKTAAAVTAKTAIVEEAEQLAQGSNWRLGANRMRELLDSWKSLARLDKPTDDALWHRFSSARTTYTRRRKQHFVELNGRRDVAKAVKQQLALEAEALADSTDWGATARAYRELMVKWKAAGGAKKEVDDALWKRFRGAQDTFFAAREGQHAKLDEEYAANAETKLALLVEAEKLLPVTEAKAARETFRDLAAKWDEAGKVPREVMKDLEGRFKRVEQAVRGATEDRWRQSNPEARARSADTVQQLQGTIAALQADLEKAETAGDAKGVADARAGIAARQMWLDQARRAYDEFST